MSTIPQLERLAAMANALRPDWPTGSVLTHLKANHGTRPYQDLAIAIAWIATDPDTATPARLAEAGPWWQATQPHPPPTTKKPPTRGAIDIHGRCQTCGGLHHPNAPHDAPKTPTEDAPPDYHQARAQLRGANDE
ncbi:hypothetical protein [Kribbella deserti]|uniref:Uncharacterized protein n=1 Tax=Kribbella deserti TaxID=1926257 RepID=A0ABV6QQY9_9ACTN